MEPTFDAIALSQAEIDAMLAKMASDGVEEAEPTAKEQQWKNVKDYDFRRPDKLSKDQMRTLQLLHESFARSASSSLSAYLRTAVQMNLVSLDQGLYGEYLDQIPPEAVLHILTMDPLPGNLMIGLDQVVAMAAVDRLLGGSGAAPGDTRTPTEIELALVHTVVSNMLKDLKEAWSRVEDVTPTVRDVVLDARYVQVALKADPVVVVAFEISLLHCSGTVTLCIPYVVIEPVMPKLTAQLWFANPRRDGGAKAGQLRRNLEAINVDLVVELGSASVMLQDLSNLKIGDVLCLDRASSAPLDLLIGGRKKFAARPGVIGNRLSVQVTSKVEDDDFMELVEAAGAVSV